ncbi:MAG: serine/threonine protein kinase [Candidatus Riflebacteria bacterium]|nr:serine/threonine protein kinase [Candidatus Riflebacteria bacterium]
MESTDRYEARKELGSGGMGEVFLAFDRVASELVALKAVNQEVAEEILARFDRERELLARLSHPAIVPILDSGRLPSGRYYYTMRYVENSRSLSSWLRDQLRDASPPVAPRLAVPIVEDVASALGLVNSALTRTGTILGTMGYLSPEQAAGGDARAPSDIFQLGLVLYQMATGRRASQDAFVHVSDMAQGKRPFPPPSLIEPRICPELEEVILKATSLAQADRWPTCAAMVARLKAIPESRWTGESRSPSDRHGSPSREVSPGSRAASVEGRAGAASPAMVPAARPMRRLVWAAIAVAAVAVLVGLILLRAHRPGVKSHPDVTLGFERAAIYFETTVPCSSEIRFKCPVSRTMLSTVERTRRHRHVLGPLNPQASYSYEVTLDGGSTVAAGSLSGPLPPELRQRAATLAKGELIVSIQLTSPATGHVRIDRAGEAPRKVRLSDPSTSHRVTIPEFFRSGPVTVEVEARSILDETVLFPRRTLTPTGTP